jgi:cardiolipin synthase
MSAASARGTGGEPNRAGIGRRRAAAFPASARWRRVALGAVLAATFVACARTQPHLELPALQIGDPVFEATLEGYTGTPIVGGNRIDLLLNGDEIFPAQIEAITSARATINYAQYVVEDGLPSTQVVGALAERCRAGVRVNVLLDGFGALAMPAGHRSELEGAGCRVETFRPLSPFALDRANYRNHRRILVVDGRIGITGGSGTSGKWAGNGRVDGHWRDTDVRIEGPVVEQLQGAFAENWLETTGIALGGEEYFPRPLERKGPAQAQVVRSSPAGGSAAMATMFLLAIASARRSVDITNPYFVPDESLRDTIVRAARKGVRIRIMLPGPIDHNIVRQASRSELGALLLEGIEIYQYQAALLHAKTMVVDGVWATVGSTNLDRRSFAINDELNVAVYDRPFARRLQAVFERDLEHSRKVTYTEWRRRGIFARLLELLAIPIKDQL